MGLPQETEESHAKPLACVSKLRVSIKCQGSLHETEKNMPSIRMTILNVDESTVSPLKFRGWLRNEAIDIQRTARGKDDIILIRLFMTDRLRFAITQPALDKILKAVVDKHPNIYRIELEVGAAPLSTSEVMDEVSTARNDLKSAVEDIESGPKTPPTFH